MIYKKVLLLYNPMKSDLYTQMVCLGLIFSGV